jgi:D-arabinose 1-dehydrogenase-like Zn-dependent alcohol dehydrogenase
MRAVTYDAFGAPPRVETVADPEVPQDGVVVRVEATGLCRSDWHGWQGHDDDIATLPHVPGHELAGTIEVVGEGVSGWNVGDRVTTPFVNACGTCPTCRQGDQQICDRQRQPGFTHWGSFAELVALDWAEVNLVAIPEAVSFETAASLGCRFATAYRAVVQVGRAVPGEWVAIHGCGGVGLSALLIAKAVGARVVAVDVSPAALELATRLGAELALPAGTDIRDATDGGVHLSLEAIGHPDACAASIGGLRKRGRHVQVGLMPEAPRVAMDQVITRELELLGSHGLAARHYPSLLELIAEQHLDPAQLITARIGLAEAPSALAAMDDPSHAGVTMIEPQR